MKVENKCFAIVAAEDTIIHVKKVADKLIDHIKEYPIFVLILSERNHKNLSKEPIDISSPVVQAEWNSPVLNLFCPKQTKKYTKLLWTSTKHKNFKEICPSRENTLRIAYNIDLPFFNLENSTADMDTIEAIVIDTFLEKHKLTAEWDDAQGSWGSRDLNGMFNGVVGKVIHVYLTILYFFVFRLDIPYVTLEYQ